MALRRPWVTLAISIQPVITTSKEELISGLMAVEAAETGNKSKYRATYIRNEADARDFSIVVSWMPKHRNLRVEAIYGNYASLETFNRK